MVDFSQYMDKPIGEMVRVLLPPGHYFGRVKGFEPVESATHKPMLKVQFTLDSAGDDVPADQLPPQGVANKQLTANYLMAEDFGQAAIGDMIRATGIEIDPAQGWGQYLPGIVNQPVKLYVTQRPRNKDEPDGEKMEDVQKVLPVN